MLLRRKKLLHSRCEAPRTSHSNLSKISSLFIYSCALRYEYLSFSPWIVSQETSKTLETRNKSINQHYRTTFLSKNRDWYNQDPYFLFFFPRLSFKEESNNKQDELIHKIDVQLRYLLKIQRRNLSSKWRKVARQPFHVVMESSGYSSQLHYIHATQESIPPMKWTQLCRLLVNTYCVEPNMP